MRKTHFFFGVLLLVSAFGFAQNKKALSHFWDIPWGTNIEQAEQIFKDRGLVSFREGNSLMTRASYESEEAVILLLFNRANRFYCGNVIYPSAEETAMSKYEKYRLILFRRYGMPDTAVAYVEAPYEKGGGEVEAIKTDNGFYFTEWRFKDENLASLTILQNLDVCLSFKNPLYADTALSRR